MFLGYSLDDIDLHVLLKSLRPDYQKSPDRLYSIQLEPKDIGMIKRIIEGKFHDELTKWFDKKCSDEDMRNKISSFKQFANNPTETEQYFTDAKEFIHDNLEKNQPETVVIWEDVRTILDVLYCEYIKQVRGVSS